MHAIPHETAVALCIIFFIVLYASALAMFVFWLNKFIPKKEWIPMPEPAMPWEVALYRLKAALGVRWRTLTLRPKPLQKI